ncbi:3-oxoacyl-[acyl-carrier-protein] reductase FabG [subsurface metagenome]
MISLKNKVAIVTGAARGIGQSIAIELARFGANVVVSDVLPGNITVNKIKKLRRKAIFVKTDVSNKQEVSALINNTIKKFKRIDILVNNAGVFRSSLIENLSEQDWIKTMDINLKGYFLCAQAVIKHMMKKRQGVIINIASVAGLVGYPQAEAYCASKGGIILFTKSLAADLGKYGIRVNAICPGVIETAMTQDILSDKKTKQGMLAKIPLSRIGKPRDIAGCAVFIASDLSSYITGTTLVVDGGWTCAL